jgi:hypothetical protein
MKASELRIGNYLRSNDVNMAYYFTVTASFLKQNENEMSWFIEEIPLTEEWLLKFGFIEYIDFGVKMGTYDKMPLCGFTYSIHTKKVMIMHKGNSMSHWLKIDIDYVHQLQNIYFALTGEELTIKI